MVAIRSKPVAAYYHPKSHSSTRAVELHTDTFLGPPDKSIPFSEMENIILLDILSNIYRAKLLHLVENLLRSSS
jgi:hypothetical protein